MKTLGTILAVFVLTLMGVGTAMAQEEQTGLCAPVKIVISQQLTLERVGFLATMQVTDNDGTDPITGFSANLTFENPLLSTNGTVNDSSSLFFVQPPTLQNIQNVSGSGVIQPGATATISWFIIPTVNAGGMTPNGIMYNIGASLSGQFRGQQIPASSMVALPATITVYPDAQLQITYFTPRDVEGINPFTLVGSPIPFTFGVLVQNVGYGVAENLQIASEQPQIVENVQNLPLVAQLLGTRVNDSPLNTASLTADLGNLNPGQTVKGAWDMIVTFSGTFLSVNASYTHSTALGGQETSLIKSVNAYLFLHEVLDDQPGKDSIKDFLTDASGQLDPILNMIPDSLYESDGSILPVNFLTNCSIEGTSSPFTVSLNANESGWGYMRLNDPEQNKLPVASVVRSDGKILNTNNYWTSIHYAPGNIEEYYLNLFDLVGLGQYSYSVTYSNPPPNTNPPVTTIMFAGPSTYTNGLYYITPDTTIYFLSQDASPVRLLYSLTNSPFLPAIPFDLSAPGTYSISYYGIDANGNQEAVHNATLVVAGQSSLQFASANIPSQPFYVPGDALSVRPVNIPISFSAQPTGTQLNAQIDIFQGVIGWATVSNVPSSPTASTTASLVIGGQDVDDYIYQLNNGPWSAEQSVTNPLTLSGLQAGLVTVSVLGRSQYGAYLDPSNAVSVSWTIDPSAPATTVSGAPATPTPSQSAALNIGGVGVTDYRWTLNNSYYRASSPVATPLLFSNLNNGPQLVEVLGGINGNDQPTNQPTSVAWTIDPLYGYNLSFLSDVRTVYYTNLSGPVSFNWDGRDNSGDILPPGWYTIRLTLDDSLGHTNFTVGLAQIAPLSGAAGVIAGYSRNAQNPSARGRWVVWQDQSDGNWAIYARDVTQSNGSIIKLTDTPLAQENPKTDGTYAVWQGQQTDGSWDVYLDNLATNLGPEQITDTPLIDEVNPAVDWPWMVCQTRATGDTNAPWLVYAYNLTNGQSVAVSPSGENELDPAVQSARVVWQDFRDPGPGEIYFYDLEKSQLRRITTNIFGQYHPEIQGRWIVWEDNRNTNLDIYGFDLVRNREIQITSDPYDHTQPVLNGQWLICMENSLGPQTGNPRLIQLPTLLSVPVTRTTTFKSSPVLADGWVLWQETVSNQTQVAGSPLPTLQAAFQNRNLIVVTPQMAAYAQNAYGLLGLWASNGVQQITEYTSLTSPVTTQSALLANGSPAGDNFTLVPGTFLWLGFAHPQVLDLGLNSSAAINLSAGGNVFTYTAYPDSYNAYELLSQIGLENAVSVRMLDAQSGRWRMARVNNGALEGDNFWIPRVAVLVVNVANPVNNFIPRSP